MTDEGRGRRGIGTDCTEEFAKAIGVDRIPLEDETDACSMLLPPQLGVYALCVIVWPRSSLIPWVNLAAFAAPFICTATLLTRLSISFTPR